MSSVFESVLNTLKESCHSEVSEDLQNRCLLVLTSVLPRCLSEQVDGVFLKKETVYLIFRKDIFLFEAKVFYKDALKKALSEHLSFGEKYRLKIIVSSPNLREALAL